MNDDEIIDSARGMVLSWLGEMALMLRVDQTPEQQGLDASNRIVERHMDYILGIRATLAALWEFPNHPDPFPFQEREHHHYLSTGCLHGDHGYCQSPKGRMGDKKPHQCKFCDAMCVCHCHHEETHAQQPVHPQLSITAEGGPGAGAVHGDRGSLQLWQERLDPRL